MIRETDCRALPDPQILRPLSGYYIRGDMAGAMRFLADVPELKELLDVYVSIFEKENYIRYDLPDDLNAILLIYQQYFRDVFYLRLPEPEAAASLLQKLRIAVGLPDGDETALAEALERRFSRAGYHILCGKTNGHYGPYVWKTTVPTVFTVELPDTVSRYTVNMLRDFVLRSWMDYLTFGEFGTGGWASPDGTINCVESAYDLESEKFRVSLLKHEAQHAEDMRRWPEITPPELEYRAKLVELIYTEQTDLLEKFRSEAAADRTADSHAAASARIQEEFGTAAGKGIPEIRKQARALFVCSTAEMERKYPSPKGVCCEN